MRIRFYNNGGTENGSKKGRVTIPTNLDVVKETLDIMDEWGADAIRDCDGTEFPQELKDTGAKIYATYYTTRKDKRLGKSQPGRDPADVHIMSSFPPQFLRHWKFT